MARQFHGPDRPARACCRSYYTELIASASARRKIRRFAISSISFNHRMISLFYQAWEKYRFTVAYERERRRGDRFSHHLLDLIGLGTTGLENRQDVPTNRCCITAACFALQPRSATALRADTRRLFRGAGRSRTVRRRLVSPRRQDQCRFDEGATSRSSWDVGAVVGDEIWDQQAGVRISLGPLDAAAVPGFSARRGGLGRFARWPASSPATRWISKYSWFSPRRSSRCELDDEAGR